METGSRPIPLELYIHIPFCIRKCAYCDFLSFPAGEEERSLYVEQLAREIEEAGALSVNMWQRRYLSEAAPPLCLKVRRSEGLWML